MDNWYNTFLKVDNIGVELVFTDLVFQKHFKEKRGRVLKKIRARPQQSRRGRSFQVYVIAKNT